MGGLKPNVMVVDDHIGSAMMMAEVFRQAGHDVRVAVGGNESIRAAVADQPDVILMDINLPDIGGVEAAKRIKTLLPQVRIIAISGLQVPAPDEGDMVIFDACLQKPVRPEKLLAALGRVCGQGGHAGHS